MLRFPYTEYLDLRGKPLWMPHIDIEFRHGRNALKIYPALVDTGATYSVLPSSIAAHLGIKINRAGFASVSTASGDSMIYPASGPISCVLTDPKTGECVEWKATLFFSDELETALIGHRHFLEKFNVTFKGKEKVIEMEPLFLTSSIGRSKKKRK